VSINPEIISSLPKIELHLHLDCSLSYDVVNQLRPGITEKEYKQNFIAPEKCIDLADFLRCSPSGIELMQTEDELRAIVTDLFQQLHKENVIYAEMRFAPFLHVSNGLSPGEVVEIVADSVQESIDATGINAGIILCTLRHFDEEQSLHTIKLVERHIYNTPVVGFDIASDEAGFPIDAHKKAFDYAIKRDIPRTAHAGEARGAGSVWETLRYFKPQRIGHGVRSIEDERLVEYLVNHDIHLEICPTCNIQINVFDEYSDHPINHLYEAGVSVGVNTDARALVNVSLTDEYLRLADVFDWGIDHFYRCNMNALEHAFIPDSEKESLRGILLSGYSIYIL
jgi:adenosine deaminase